MNAQNNNICGTSLTNLADTENNATNVGSVTHTYIGGRNNYYLRSDQSGLTNASINHVT